MSLRERRDIVTLHHAAPSGTPGVMLTLVAVRGSSYRRPGAHLLTMGEHGFAGTLSGGCLEADLLRRAAWMVRAGAVLEHVSMLFDDTADVPYGLGCGGEVDLLLEPSGTPEIDAQMEAWRATLNGDMRTVVTCLPGVADVQRIVMDESGDVLFASESLDTADVADLRHVARGTAGNTCVQVGRFAAFVEHLQPAQRLVVFGAGEDARPLTRMAAEMGWSVIVVDSHSTAARADRFRHAERVMLAPDAASAGVSTADAVVLMTHSYEQDRKLLAELLPIAPRYLGILGARHRSALLLQEAASIAGLSLAQAVERTHAPVGLALGGDGPEAVALAIVAELQFALARDAASGVASRRISAEEITELLGTLDTKHLNPSRSACVLG